jgi:hypothetical protein
MAVLILLNNFLHDFSAAGWIFCTVILGSMLKYHVPGSEAAEVIVRILKNILLLMRLSLTGIVLFGIIRALAYRNYEWSSAAGEIQILLLIVKHIILLIVFLVGLVFYLKARKVVKAGSDEQPG